MKRQARTRYLLIAAIGFCLLSFPSALQASVNTVRGAESLEPVQAAPNVDGFPEVTVLMYFTDLFEIRGSDQSFAGDVFIRASWNDPRLAGVFEDVRTLDWQEVWHPTLLVVNERAVTRLLPEVVQVFPNGDVMYMQRYSGDFSAFMDLRDFPLDRQEFSVWVIAAMQAGQEVELIPDTTVLILGNDQPSVTDWNVSPPRLESAIFRQTPSAQPISGVKIVVEAKRRVGYYVIQVIIPLVAIVLMAWTVFWIDPAVVATRVGVVVTTMLTLIAYRFMLANHVPRLSYLTRLDYFMLGGTILVILVLFVMAGASFLQSQGKQESVKHIDRVGRMAFPLVFAAFFLTVWFL
jgi:hypothetical protein